MSYKTTSSAELESVLQLGQFAWPAGNNSIIEMASCVFEQGRSKRVKLDGKVFVL